MLKISSARMCALESWRQRREQEHGAWCMVDTIGSRDRNLDPVLFLAEVEGILPLVDDPVHRLAPHEAVLVLRERDGKICC